MIHTELLTHYEAVRRGTTWLEEADNQQSGQDGSVLIKQWDSLQLPGDGLSNRVNAKRLVWAPSQRKYRCERRRDVSFP